MRIHRQQSRLTFRKQRQRRSGCLSLAVFVGLLVGIVVLSRNWVEQRLTSVISQQPINTASLTGARQAFERGDLDTTIELARQFLVSQPANAEALDLLARALIYRSYSDYDRALDRQAALEATTLAVQSAPSNADLLASHAFALQAAGNPGEAAEAAERVLEQNPNHGLARAALALAYSNVGSHEIALRESQTAANSPGWQVDTQRALALGYSGVGDYDRAIAAIESAISVNSKLLPLYFERALFALQIGDADSATEAYFNVLAYDPTNVKAHLRLCELSSLLRERENAIDYCSQVTELAPSWADGWYQLGREYFLDGNYQQARDHLKRCSSLQVMQSVPVSERRFECWYLQGQAAEILGDCQTLLATYNEFRSMAADAAIQQTWTYPPEGPAICLGTGTPGM
jgi:tetratricopeptide (TPR) repeat protein